MPRKKTNRRARSAPPRETPVSREERIRLQPGGPEWLAKMARLGRQHERQ